LIKRIDKMLSRISLQRKIIIIFLGSALIPLFLQVFYSLSMIEERLQTEMIERMKTTLFDRAGLVRLGIGDAINVSLRYNNDERIYAWLENDYGTNYEYFLTYQEEIQSIISDIPSHQQIENIILYTDNKTLFNGSLIRRVGSIDDPKLGEALSFYHDNWLDREEGQLRLRSSVQMPQAVNATQEERQISILRKLDYYPQYRNNGKMLMINLSPAYFNRILSDTELFTDFYIVDTEDHILFSTKAYNQTGMFEVYDAEELPKGIVSLEQKIGDYPLTLYGHYNSKIISEQFRDGRTGAGLIFLAGLLIATICLVFIGKNITKRTRQIVRQSQEIAKGNFVISDSAGYSKDEIGTVEKGINYLSLQLRELIEKGYKAELNQARLESETNRAKLQALQSQVNPHFLFNALESIRLKAQVNNEIETATMIKYMSKMFRYIIDWSDEVVPLSEDIKFLQEFLSIQQYRFGNEFEYRVDIEQGAEKAYLPKMLIQPLVENACVHGVESISGRRFVSVDIRTEGNYLCVLVGDNGGGIKGNRVAEILKNLEENKNSHKNVGLTNVYQRLCLYYGTDFEFNIESEIAKGTVCTVKIPFSQENKVD
jgi:Predicted signal transduction protein with a C-terminal ATPase domain